MLADLTAEQIDAICHGRTALANLGGTHMLGDEWVQNHDHVGDPAIPDRLVSLNTLEALLTKHGCPSRPNVRI